MENEEFDTEYTDEIVCPWCGHEHEDSWDHFSSYGCNTCEFDCDSCGKTIYVEQIVKVTYSSSKEESKQPPPKSGVGG